MILKKITCNELSEYFNWLKVQNLGTGDKLLNSACLFISNKQLSILYKSTFVWKQPADILECTKQSRFKVRVLL